MARRTTPRGWRDIALPEVEAALAGIDSGARAADKQRRDRLYRVAQLARCELIEEVVATAEHLAAARDLDGETIVRTDPVWRLLVTLERSSYCCSISDAARLLSLSRQRAHQTARDAERARLVGLATNPDDRRIVQVLLTRSGRAELAATRSREVGWLNTLLNGLDDRRLAVTAHVLRVIRQRLQRTERACPPRRRGR